jgi:hypothetical protein
VLDVGAQDTLELAAARDHEPVKALAAYRADEAFGVRVRLRRSDRRLDDLDPFAAEDVVERGVELRVAVVDQEPRRLLTLGERPR